MKPTVFVVFAIGLSFLIGKTDAQACTASNPTNGMVDSTNPADGASVVYTCTDPTHILDGTTPLTCTAGSLVGGTEPTACTVPSACTATATGDLAVSEAAPAHLASTTYSCTDGAKTLDGTATQTCNNGVLSGSVPTCGAACTATATADLAVTEAAPVHGASTTYSCTDNTKVLTGTATQTCTDSSLSAAPPTCAAPLACTATATGDLAVTEAAPAHLASTTYSCTDNTKVLTGTATQTCNNGALSSTPPTCAAGTACTATATGDLAVTEAAPAHLASTTYSCTDNTKTLTGTATQTCNNGALSGSPPTCAVAANNAPVFSSATYGMTVTDGAAAGTDVGTVTITDADTDTWTFTITSGDSNGDFAITNTVNLKVGTIATAKALDKDTTSSYTLTVSLTDGTTPVTTTVTITFSGASTFVPMLLLVMICSLYNYV